MLSEVPDKNSKCQVDCIALVKRLHNSQEKKECCSHKLVHPVMCCVPVVFVDLFIHSRSLA